MKIFVTGGTGFIGSHFLNRAFQAGHEVVALRRSVGSTPRVPLVATPKWIDSPMDELKVDDFKECQALVHLAAIGVSPQKATWNELVRFNVLATMQICNTAYEAGIKRHIVAGSYAEYGKVGEHYEYIPPNAPLEPAFPYAASKAAAFVLLYALSLSKLGELFYGRIFSTFGEGQHESNFWPSLRKAALEGEDFPMTAGEQVRDFIPVEQVADAFLAAMIRTDLKPGEPKIQNLGTGQPQTLRAFAEHWWKVWNAKGKLLIGALPYRDNEVMRYVPSVS